MKRIGIDIFSGAGGLSLGASMAGIEVRYAIEINPHAAKSFECNHKGVKVICMVDRLFLRQVQPGKTHVEKYAPAGGCFA